MTSIAALSAAALLAGLSAAPSGPTSPGGGDVSYEAAQVVWHGETGRYELTGGVVVRRGAVVLRARTADYDPATGEVDAAGDVLLVEPTRVIQAQGMHVVLDGPFEATQVVAFYKDRPLEPVRITSLAEARRGRNRVSATADRVEGEDEDRMTLYGARFTLCDCGEGKAPTWEVGARKAEVKGDRVALTWPVFRVTPRFLFVQRPVPVLVLPWLSLPLKDRQSGLLFPEVGQRGVTGFFVRQPAYVTLGRSADMTVSPEYFFGPKDEHRGGGAVKGPGAQVQLRWAPAERAYGEVLLHLVDDQDEEQEGGAGGAGVRLALRGWHAQDLGARTRLVADLTLSQDPYMFRDLGGLPIANPYYGRSDVLVSHRTSDWVLEGGAMYLEPLVWGNGVSQRPPRFGVFGAQAPVLHRWPSASATLLPVRLGPVQVEGRAGVARYAPLTGHSGVVLPADPGFGRSPDLTDATVGALDREAASRGDARLQLAAPYLLGSWLSVEPYVRGAANGYAFDATRDPETAAWGVAGIAGYVELARRFGPLEHRIVPRLELLSGTETWRSGAGQPFAAYDLWDRVETERIVEVDGTRKGVLQKLSAAPEGAFTQLRATLENRLDAGKGGSFSFQLGQDVDVRRDRLAESSVSVSFSKGPVGTWGNARFLAFGGRPPRSANWKPSWLDEFTQLSAGASLRDHRGDALVASLGASGSGAVGAQGAGVDALFDLRPSTEQPAATVDLSAHLVLGGANLHYTAALAGRDIPSTSSRIVCGKTGQPVERGAGRVIGQTATVVWDSPCQCFTIRVHAALDACDSLSYGFDVDLSKMLQGAARKRG